jgi:hypothetical protein
MSEERETWKEAADTLYQAWVKEHVPKTENQVAASAKYAKARYGK